MLILHYEFHTIIHHQQLEILHLGDIVQLGGAALLTLLGFQKGHSRLAPFGFGALAAQVATKVIFPHSGYDRYILFDIDARGRLAPSQKVPKM